MEARCHLIQRSAVPGTTAAMTRDLAEITRSIDALDNQTSPERLAKLPLSGLLALERHLKFLDLQLQQWQTRLQVAARPLTADATALAQQRKLWQDTRQLSADLMVPTLQLSIDNLLAEFEQAQQQLADPLAQLLKLSHEANSVAHNRVSRNLAAVRGRIAADDRGLWQLDSENLFTALWNVDRQRLGELELLLNGFKAEMEFMKEFDRVTAGTHNLVMFLSLLLLPVFWWLSRRANKALGADPELAPYRKVLTRPFSAWLLLTVAVLALVQFQGPLLRLKILLILAWWPAMRLQSNTLREQVGRWTYLTGGCFLINLGCQMVVTLPVLFRLAVLFNALLMLAAFGWLLFRSLRAAAGDSRRPRMLRGLVAIGTVDMTVAIGANLIGNVTLATMLTDATLSSVYLGLFLLAISSLCRAFASFLFRSAAERLRSKTHHAGRLMEASARLFSVGLFLCWGWFTLEAFRCLRPLQDWLQAVASFPLQ